MKKRLFMILSAFMIMYLVSFNVYAMSPSAGDLEEHEDTQQDDSNDDSDTNGDSDTNDDNQDNGIETYSDDDTDTDDDTADEPSVTTIAPNLIAADVDDNENTYDTGNQPDSMIAPDVEIESLLIAPDTGDASNISLYITFAGLAGAAVVTYSKIKKIKKV